MDFPDQKEVLEGMQNAIHLAVFISPLALLLPRQFHGLAVRRDYLIGVSYIDISVQ
jgi:hypothetical protein